MLDKIKTLCAIHQITLKDLEEQCGIGKNSFYKWDSQSPAVKSVKAVADYFHVSVDYLIDEESAVDDQETALIAKFRLLTASQKETILSNIDFLLSQSPIKKETATSSR